MRVYRDGNRNVCWSLPKGKREILPPLKSDAFLFTFFREGGSCARCLSSEVFVLFPSVVLAQRHRRPRGEHVFQRVLIETVRRYESEPQQLKMYQMLRFLKIFILINFLNMRGEMISSKWPHTF